MDRLFTSKQKKILFILSNGRCQKCGCELGRNWEADHIIPFSKGGKTEINNGQALCRSCNRLKSNHMIEFRPWQKRFFEKVNERIDGGRKKFFCVAGVGSGKTFASLAIADHAIKNKGFNSVVVISNTENIKGGWAYTALSSFGMNLDTDYNFKYDWRADYDGISITNQSLNPANAEVLKRKVDRSTLFIIDEAHHSGDNKRWGIAIKEIGDMCGFVLLLSGTPTRNDNSKIPFVDYIKISDEEYQLNADFSYSYAQSVQDGICCPVRFHKHTGYIETFTGDIVKITKDTKEEDARPYLDKLLDPMQSDFVEDVFRRADNKLNEINELRGESYAGLVVCNGIGEATALHKMLTEKYGNDFAVLVHSQDKESNQKINDFKSEDTPWIISVNMVSEGVDISRIRVIVYATNYTTPLFFTQVIGRGVRNPIHYENDMDYCHVYIPEYAPLIDNAEKIKEQLRHIVKDEVPKETRGEYTYGGKAMSLEDFIMQGKAEYSGSISQGFTFSRSDEEFIASLASESGSTNETIMFHISAWMQRKQDVNDIAVAKIAMTKTDRKKHIRQTIHKKVGYIYALLGKSMDFKEINNELNQKIGGINQHAMTESQLKEKLMHAENWISKLKANLV